jgi:lipoprotein-anchoring transpeptidase ErfK/SrfK
MRLTRTPRRTRVGPHALAIAAVALLPALTGAPRAEAERSAAPPRLEATAPEASISLRVDLGERRLRVIEDGKVVKTYVVAVGKAGHRTPQGTFTIRRMEWNPGWVPPNSPWARGLKPRAPGDPRNPMGRIKIFFREPTYFIHGTPDEGSLGSAASHGCIRMSNADAMELGRLLMEHGGRSQPESWFERVRGQRTRTEQVTLPRPIRMTVRG